MGLKEKEDPPFFWWKEEEGEGGVQIVEAWRSLAASIVIETREKEQKLGKKQDQETLTMKRERVLKRIIETLKKATKWNKVRGLLCLVWRLLFLCGVVTVVGGMKIQLWINFYRDVF